MAERITRWRQWLPWVAGLAILAIMLGVVDTAAVLDSLARADVSRFVGLAMAFILLWWVIESINLTDLFRLFGHARPFTEVLTARAYTYLLLVINYSLGLVGMAVYARSRAGLPFARASSVMLIYTHAETAALALLTLGGAWWVRQDPVMASLGLIAAGYLAFSIALMVLCQIAAFRRTRLAQTRLVSAFTEASPLTLMRLIAGRTVYFGSFVLFFWLALPAFGLSIPMTALLATVPAIFLIGNLPVTAAGVGTIQAAMLYFFRDFGPAAAILAFSICYSAALILLRIPIGLLAAARAPTLLTHQGEPPEQEQPPAHTAQEVGS